GLVEAWGTHITIGSTRQPKATLLVPSASLRLTGYPGVKFTIRRKHMPNIVRKYILLCLLAAISSCSEVEDEKVVQKAKYNDFSLANDSERTVYGFYEFGEREGTVGVIGAGKSKTEGFAPFSIQQSVVVSFKCEFEDVDPCAIGEVDISKHYPSGDYEIITTVFTYKPNNTVDFGFSVKKINSNPGERFRIHVGSISK
ncbi:hypothetical protein SAMN02745866_01671, partial [Alteromonadaceae bacterium Bs31]